MKIFLLAVALAAAATLAPSAASAATHNLSVVPVTGGTVTSAPAGINCGPDCFESYLVGSTQVCEWDSESKTNICWNEPSYVDVTLTATPASGWVFNGWSGSCGGLGTCNITMNAARNVTPSFRDIQLPSVTLNVAHNSTVAGTNTIGATASDNHAVAMVEFWLGGTKLGQDTSAPYSLSWNSTATPDGTYQLFARAHDLSGQTTDSARGITIDNTAPSLSITSGPNGSEHGTAEALSWAFSASDANGVAAVDCRITPQGSSPGAFTACSGASSHTVSGLAPGSYTFSVRARDAVANGTIVNRSFSIDGTPPETTITGGPADGSSQTETGVTFGFSASEPGSTFQCRLYPAGVSAPGFGACSGPAAHTAAGLPVGTYAFEVVATDPRSNVDATPAKRTFTVAAPPVVTPPPVITPPPPPVVENCVVPALKGKTLAQAKTALAAAKCSTGAVKKAFSATVKKGRVLKQGVAVGRRLAKGAAIGITLSKGRRP